jgi:penicillin-binding protein 2
MRNSIDTASNTPVRIARVVSVGIFILLGAALFRLQVVKGRHYTELSESNYIVQASIKAPRGVITDSDGTLIAGSRQSFSICGIPRTILGNKVEISRLGRILGVEEDFILSRLKETAHSYRPATILRDVDFATLSRVEEMFADLPDVIVVSEPVRHYPDGVCFSHVVGYVGEVTRSEIEADEARYGPGDFIGKAGIEKIYEKHLRGRDGTKYVKFAPGGGAGPVDVDYMPADAPRQGSTVVLAMDGNLQRLAHELLEGKRGCVIALDPRTGGVLALASNPAFDPNLFATGISGPAWEGIVEAPGKPLLNRAIRSSYPPGSTYKLVTAAAALEAGRVSKNTRFKACTGAYRFGDRSFGCWKPEGHGSTNLEEAIEVSCDVYFYQLGERLELDRYSFYAGRWQLDRKTGIDLPGEIAGLVPSPAYYDRIYGERKWTRGLMLNLAIGQGELLATPMGIACFTCALANGGTYVRPHCVDRIESEGRTELVTGEPVNLGMSESTLEVLRSSMLRVVAGSHGTGRAVALPGLAVAGKTGTAQNPHGDDHASFVCFAPYVNPEIVVYVLVENAGHGSTAAAPIARSIMASHFGIPVAEEVALTR